MHLKTWAVEGICSEHADLHRDDAVTKLPDGDVYYQKEGKFSVISTASLTRR